ncbi:MAG: tryptophan synthase subunit beta [Bacteroidia bacterium]|nr:MAG: tryptophan synthase subunit beta [Bacteroidia bacterium]
MNTLQAYYGEFGGQFVPPVLIPNLTRLSEAFEKLKNNNTFNEEYIQLLKDYVGRPTPLFLAKNLSEKIGSKVYLKREDLNHTGAHKINNTIGQCLMAKYMNATEIIAETGAGQHGVATATAAALFNIPCKIFMGKTDMERQSMNVERMRLLGAEVVPTSLGSQTLADAVDAALNYFVEHPSSFYCLGSQVGPHPYPNIVGYFQKVIGDEAVQQIQAAEGRLPDNIFACIGGGSNAIGIFQGFLEHENVKLFGAEGAGEGALPKTAATLSFGNISVFQGARSYCLTDEEGNPTQSWSIAAGLDYPGISPQHAYLKDTQRAQYYPITDKEAIDAFYLLARTEGIIPAIESAHAVALADKLLKGKANQVSIINVSGRGDKDVERRLRTFV